MDEVKLDNGYTVAQETFNVGPQREPWTVWVARDPDGEVVGNASLQEDAESIAYFWEAERAR